MFLNMFFKEQQWKHVRVRVFTSDPPQKTDSCDSADLQTTWHRWERERQSVCVCVCVCVCVLEREGCRQGDERRELKSSSYNGAFIRFVLQLLVSDLSVQAGLMDA